MKQILLTLHYNDFFLKKSKTNDLAKNFISNHEISILLFN